MGSKTKPSHMKKCAVEECSACVDQEFLHQIYDCLPIPAQANIKGVLKILNSGGAVISSFGYLFQIIGPSMGALTFNYTICSQNKNQQIATHIGVSSGGKDFKGQPFYCCPFCKEYGRKPNRSKKLYFTLDDPVFSCRKCKKLTYLSTRESRNSAKETAYLAQALNVAPEALRQATTVKEIIRWAREIRLYTTPPELPPEHGAGQVATMLQGFRGPKIAEIREELGFG